MLPILDQTIEFFDSCPRAAGDRSPRIIGQLTDIGAGFRDAFPRTEYGTDDSYNYYPDPKQNFLIRARMDYEHGLQVIIRDLSNYALRSFDLNNSQPFFTLFAFNTITDGTLVPHWHRDQPESAATKVSFLIGDVNFASNTEFATIDVPLELLPFDCSGPHEPRNDTAITDFLQTRGGIAQIGKNEILEYFGDTPHRSSPVSTGFKHIARYDWHG